MGVVVILVAVLWLCAQRLTRDTRTTVRTLLTLAGSAPTLVIR